MTHQADDADDQSLASSLFSVQSLHLDNNIVSEIRGFCQSSKVSMFAFALHCLHHTLRAYNHNAFAIGVAHDTRSARFLNAMGMFVNTVLVPFGDDDRGEESVEDVEVSVKGLLKY